MSAETYKIVTGGMPGAIFRASEVRTKAVPLIVDMAARESGLDLHAAEATLYWVAGCDTNLNPGTPHTVEVHCGGRVVGSLRPVKS